MNAPNVQPVSTAASVLATVGALRADMLEKSGEMLRNWNVPADGPDAALVNLAHYMAIRSVDLRSLQRRLMALGLS